MSACLIDLSGVGVGAEQFLSAVLESAAQPLWVVDPDGTIRFANPAALEALGYDSAEELYGRESHATIHHRRPDGTPFPAHECPMLLPRTTGDTVTSELDWFCRRDGSMFPVSYVSVPIEMAGGRGAVVAFTDIEDRLRADRAVRERDTVLAEEHARLADEKAALRQVADIVARGAWPPEVFAAVAREIGLLIDVDAAHVGRYEPDGTATGVAGWSRTGDHLPLGTRMPTDGDSVAARVRRTGLPARIDDYESASGPVAAVMRDRGYAGSVGVPIAIHEQLWGVLVVSSKSSEPFPADTEERIAGFAELVATAIANTEARAQARRLADEQAALRRVATAVAHEAPPEEVFAAVAEEVGRLLELEGMSLVRYDPGEIANVVAFSAAPGEENLVGRRVPLGGENVTTLVYRTGRAARIDDYSGATGQISDVVRDARTSRCAVGTPIFVAGRLWGAMASASRRSLPPDTEERMAQFTELVATALANAQARSDLAASRARVVAAADDERRRVVRDLHDGAQQRLVHTVITLQQAHDRPGVPGDVRALIGEGLTHARSAIGELRELARGIHPATLSHHGLAAAVDTLADRVPLPVTIDVAPGRYPPAVELAAYFVVAEALTNVAKHARAGHATVSIADDGAALQVRVSDDGAGGADPRGNGLVGVADRLAALDGRLRVESPSGGGTIVGATIPLPLSNQ